MVCMLNHTIVEFRPHRTWRGEFGFDWLRVNDELTPGQVPGHVTGEPPYKECILGSKKSGYTKATPNAAAYNDLKTEYHKLSVNSHRAAPKDEYFIPWLNLYAEDISNQIKNDYKTRNGGADLLVPPPFEAELRLIVNVQGDTKPKELEIVFPSEYFNIKYPAGSSTGTYIQNSPITIPATGVAFAPNSPGINHDLPDTIKVKCIKEFSTDQYIDVWAHHYQHTQAEIDQLEQENKQLNDTDIPALEQEKAALEAEAQTLQEQVTTQEAQVVTQQATVSQLEAEITALEAQCAAKKTIYQTIESQLQAFSLLSDEQKQATDNPDFQKLNLPGEREKDQAKVDQLKAEVAQLEQQIAQKKAQLEAPQKQLEDMQKQLEAKKTELEEKKNQIAAKQQEIEQKQEQATKNTEEMNKMQGRSLAGKLCVCANDAKHRKSMKVLLVNVKLNIDTAVPPSIFYESTGSLRPDEEKMLYNTLYQALIYPDTTTNIMFDRSADDKFKQPTPVSSNTFINSADEVARSTAGDFLNHLRTSFRNAHPAYSADDYWPVFFFGIDGEGMGGVGWVGRKSCSVFANGQNSMLNTPSHEILHNLGLYHTHIDYDSTYTTPVDVTTSASGPWSINRNAMKYVFNFGGWDTAHPDYRLNSGTTSVISYTQNGYSTYRWHWQIMRDHL
ncbi:hypothetical protein [Saezia sanguinis]|nr:hypothetical protein [Saezia sanguinis]